MRASFFRLSGQGLSAKLALSAVLIAFASGGSTLSAASDRPLPPDAVVGGKSQAEWSAAWWEWATPIPADHHPLTDTADVSTGQSGDVWFIGGSFVSGTAKRYCTIPTGKMLFLPVLNVECSTLECPGDFCGHTAAELSACAKRWMDNPTNLFCTIDGVAVPGLDSYRVQSPMFDFGPVPPNNVLGVPVPPDTGQSVSDGIYLMFSPLAEGEHTLHFGGAFANGFALDITYHLMVAPVLSYSRSGGQLTLSWTSPGCVLQENTSVADLAGWRDVSGGNVSPVTVTIDGGNRFFRLR
jgi:hypothetical protein